MATVDESLDGLISRLHLEAPRLVGCQPTKAFGDRPSRAPSSSRRRASAWLYKVGPARSLLTPYLDCRFQIWYHRRTDGAVPHLFCSWRLWLWGPLPFRSRGSRAPASTPASAVQDSSKPRDCCLSAVCSCLQVC